MKTAYKIIVGAMATLLLLGTTAATAQAPYQPKFSGDPARSDSEAAALGYMRNLLRAQRLYNRKNGHYAKSLMELVHTGSFTRRMATSDRGDYTVGFRSHKGRDRDKEKDAFDLTLTPKQVDAQHRSFYAGEDGVIHAEEDKAADENSPALK
jgi:hypothetical protein